MKPKMFKAFVLISKDFNWLIVCQTFTAHSNIAISVQSGVNLCVRLSKEAFSAFTYYFLSKEKKKY